MRIPRPGRTMIRENMPKKVYKSIEKVVRIFFGKVTRPPVNKSSGSNKTG